MLPWFLNTTIKVVKSIAIINTFATFLNTDRREQLFFSKYKKPHTDKLDIKRNQTHLRTHKIYLHWGNCSAQSIQWGALSRTVTRPSFFGPASDVPLMCIFLKGYWVYIIFGIGITDSEVQFLINAQFKGFWFLRKYGGCCCGNGFDQTASQTRTDRIRA